MSSEDPSTEVPVDMGLDPDFTVRGERRKPGRPRGLAAPNPKRRQCTAHKKNGERCKKPPILGGTVCTHHGGSAPAVRAKAAQRLAAAADSLMATLLRIAASAESETVQLAAVRDALDRAGFGAAQLVKLAQAKDDPWGDLLAEVMDDDVLPVGTAQRRALTATPTDEEDEDYNARAEGEPIYHPDADDAAPLDGWRINNDGEQVVRGEVIRSRVNPPRHIRDGLDLDGSGRSRRVDFG